MPRGGLPAPPCSLEEELVTQTRVLIRTHPRAQLRLVHFVSCQFCLKRKETLGSSQVIIRLLKGLGTAGGCLHLTLKNAKKTGWETSRREQGSAGGVCVRGVCAGCVRGVVGASHCIINPLNLPCV